MFNFFKKYSVTILDEKWAVIKENVKIKHIPRSDELIYLDGVNKYYRVVNVIHNLNNRQDIYIIIEKYTDDFDLMYDKSR